MRKVLSALLFFVVMVISVIADEKEDKIEKVNVAVLDLKEVGVPNSTAVLLSDALRSELFKYEKFKLMNREDMKEIMEEQSFQNSGACDTKECYVELGLILGVEKIITGSIGKLGSTFSMTIKMIDIESGENDKIINYRKKCTEDDLFVMIENSTKELSGLVAIKKITISTGLINIEEKKVLNNIQNIKSPYSNVLKSLFVPGWGNLKRKESYFTTEIFGVIFALLTPLYEEVHFANLGFVLLYLNHIVAPIDAFISTTKYNENFIGKNKLSFLPKYNYKKKEVGIGFALKF